MNRFLLRLVLERSWPHCTVCEAEDGQKAVQALQEMHHDLVFMDMVMPHMDGIEATQALRASQDPRVARTPVIGLTANVNQQDLARFESSGLNVLMLKPFEPEKLCEQIEQLVYAQATTLRTDTAQA
ncbi:response regulator [Limnohabitans sp. 2KL-17]|uniref:response regulator n=1 Tax=Limnohabitans sp. 2KL-17 TaxID=1100704 RepID=UPI001304B580|nr:response regulator [Limnohabitans sp. 2KL-17]